MKSICAGLFYHFSELKTSSSVKLLLVTTGSIAITLGVLSSLIQFSMSLEKKPKVAIVPKVSKSPTLLEVVLDLVCKHS